ncbi:hypothetical protein Raf01_36410 [Rugosimonospora africana]|uniref:CobW/HypB/UreG nucleotide-binding domain-containing protein n=1 Tax=Rugosimonospora africana TaxID=556532 RepID=A0A8J3QRT7_9ACTN|nr:hypothetical protein Raf01_36410 [Rugosimonospora africana]
MPTLPDNLSISERDVEVRGSALIEDDTIALLHGCVSCTLREDVLPTLVRLAHAYPDHDQPQHRCPTWATPTDTTRNHRRFWPGASRATRSASADPYPTVVWSPWSSAPAARCTHDGWTRHCAT